MVVARPGGIATKVRCVCVVEWKMYCSVHKGNEVSTCMGSVVEWPWRCVSYGRDSGCCVCIVGWTVMSFGY